MGTSYHRKSVLTPTRRNNTVAGHRQGGVVPSGHGKEDQGGVAVTAQEGKKAPCFLWHGSSQSFVTSQGISAASLLFMHLFMSPLHLWSPDWHIMAT